MRFMIIRKSAENTEAGAKASPELVAAMVGFHEDLAKAGIFKEGDGLKPSSVSTRVRFKEKKFAIVDGPFAETKELVAGYSVIDVPSKDDALAIMRAAGRRKTATSSWSCACFTAPRISPPTLPPASRRLRRTAGAQARDDALRAAAQVRRARRGRGAARSGGHEGRWTACSARRWPAARCWAAKG